MAKNNSSTEVVTQNDAKALEHFQQLAAAAGAREITSERPKIELKEFGAFVVARLAAIREFKNDKPGEKDLRVLYLDTPNHSVRLNCNADLKQKVVAELVGHWVGIQNVGTQNTGHASGTPMTSYKVFDFGTERPAFVKDDSDSDLPF